MIKRPTESRRGARPARVGVGGSTQTRSIDELLAGARSRLMRITVDDLEEAVAAGALVVDIRPVEQRRRHGEMPGALIVDRNVLEWRLAPSSDARIVDVSENQRVIIVCNEGYQSSLAAATLIELGLPGATDLVGGYQAYKAARHGAPPCRRRRRH